MSPSLALQQAYIVRAQMDLLIASLEAEQPAPTGCQHPEDKRLDISTGGGGPAMWKCLVCDAEFEGVV